MPCVAVFISVLGAEDYNRFTQVFLFSLHSIYFVTAHVLGYGSI